MFGPNRNTEELLLLKIQELLQSHYPLQFYIYSRARLLLYLYKKTNSDSAWCEFKLQGDVANRMESQGIDLNSKKSHDDWKLIFSSPPYLNESEMDRAIEFMKEPQKNCYMMKTPAKERMRQDLEIMTQNS